MPKFQLPKPVKGQTIIAGRYGFVDGEMPVSNEDAVLLSPILIRFHGCKLIADEVVQDDPKSEDSKTSESLAAKETKSGK